MNDLNIKPFNFQQAVARAGLRPDGLPRTDGVNGSGGGFQAAMNEALKSVSANQIESGRLQREFTLGNPTVSLEESVIAQEKAKVGFQAVLAVRNRLVSAYSEIMNMQV
jgi:flagellar hook-basal body complex protein FliE